VRNQTNILFRAGIDIIISLPVPMINLASHGIPLDVLTGGLVLTSRRILLQMYQQTIISHAEPTITVALPLR